MHSAIVSASQCVLILACFCMLGCSRARPNTQSIEAGTKQTIQEQQHDPVLSFGASPRFIGAWQRFLRESRPGHQYRLVGPGDYSLSDRDKAALGEDLGKTYKFRAGGGDLNKDGRYRDYILVIVDDNRADDAKFSILIFNEPETEHEDYNWHWLYQDRNLSKTVLSWFSGGVGLRTYRNGSYDLCTVVWHKSTGIYSCQPGIE